MGILTLDPVESIENDWNEYYECAHKITRSTSMTVIIYINIMSDHNNLIPLSDLLHMVGALNNLIPRYNCTQCNSGHVE